MVWSNAETEFVYALVAKTPLSDLNYFILNPCELANLLILLLPSIASPVPADSCIVRNMNLFVQSMYSDDSA